MARSDCIQVVTKTWLGHIEKDYDQSSQDTLGLEHITNLVQCTAIHVLATCTHEEDTFDKQNILRVK